MPKFRPSSCIGGCLLVAWIGSHSETDLAQSMGVAYTNDTVPLAESYLRRFAL